MFLVLLAITFVLRLPAFFVPVFNSDETFVATQAHVIEQGGELYEDATDRKPPLVPYIYAATFAFFETTALWSVRVVAMLAVALTALLLAVEARRRYGSRAGWIAGLLFVLAMVAFAPQDGQAANFEVFMLPSMTAAILFARRGRGVAAGVGGRARDPGEADRRGDAASRSLYLLGPRAREARRRRRSRSASRVPIALVALAVGPSQLLYWAVLGNGSYLGVNSVSTRRARHVPAHDLGFAACNLPLLWKLPSAWHERRQPRSTASATPTCGSGCSSAALSVAVGLRFFGHYYMQLVPPLALLAAGALRAAAATCGQRHDRGRVGARASVFSAAGYFIHPFGPEPNVRVGERATSPTNTHPDDPIFVWGSVPEIYWASDRLPATRFLTTSSFLTGNYPGRPPTRSTPTPTPKQNWDVLLRGLHRAPAAVLRRHVTVEGARRVLPDLRASQARRRS